MGTTTDSTAVTPHIEHLVRMNLPATHLPTGMLIWFPVIHVLIERANRGVLATCLEYSQSFEANTIDDAVTGLVNVMYKYFFTMVKKLGPEALYGQAKSRENDHLWMCIREHGARQHDLYLRFVHASFANDQKLLAELGKEINAMRPPTADYSVPMKDHQQIVDGLKKALQDLAHRSQELEKENRQLKSGIEGADEWREAFDLASVAPSTAAS